MNLRARQRYALAAAVLAAATFACSKRDSTPPLAAVSFVSSKPKVALDSPVDFTFKFDVFPGASFDKDYRVFVHLVDAYGKEMSWTGDHDPPIPTTQWKPGQTIQYTRTVFMPAFPYLGEATIEVGLHRDGDRVPLQAADPGESATNRSYKVGSIQFVPQSENIYRTFKSGWHPAEFAPDNQMLQWQWTQKSAVLHLPRNPKHDVMLFLEYDARPDLFPGQPQQVTVYAGDQPVDTFAADNAAAQVRRIPISAAQLGTGESAEIRIEVDRTFTPAQLPSGGNDTRQLGLRVYHVYVENR